MNDFIQKQVLEEPIVAVEPKPYVTEAAELGLGVEDLHERAFQNESIGYMLYDMNSLEVGNPDPEWNDDKAKELIPNTIHPRLRDSLASKSVSREHLAKLLPKWEKDSAVQRYMDTQGIADTLGYHILPEVTNLPIYGAAVYAGTLAAPATAATLGSMFLGRVFTGAIAEVGVEGLKDIWGQENKGAMDYLFASGLGGTINGIFGKKLTPIQEATTKEMKHTSGITKEIEDKYALAGTQEERKKILDEAYQAKNQEVLTQDGFEQLDDIMSRPDNKAYLLLDSVRQDLAHAMKDTGSDTINSFSRQMFPDPTLQRNVQDFRDLQTFRDRLEHTMENTLRSNLYGTVEAFEKEILENHGFLGIRPSSDSFDTLGKLIGYVKKHQDYFARTKQDFDIDKIIEDAIAKQGYKTSPRLVQIVKDGVDGANKVSLDFGKKLRDEGNTRFQEGGIDPNENFYHYVYDRAMITKLKNLGVSEQELVGFFRRAVESYVANSGKKMPDEYIDKTARMFYKGISESKPNEEKSFSAIIDDILETKDLKKEDKDFFQSFKEQKDTKPDSEAGVAFRERSSIDYGFKSKVIGANGKPIELSLLDFVSDDYFTNMRKYYRRSSGTTALQRAKWVKKLRPLTKEQRMEELLSHPEIKKIQQEIESLDNIKLQLSDAYKAIDNVIQDLLNSDQKDAILDMIEAEIRNFVPDSRKRLQYIDSFGNQTEMTKTEFKRLGIVARKTRDGKEISPEDRKILDKHIEYYDEHIDELLETSAEFNPNVGVDNQLGITKKTITEAKAFIKGDESFKKSFDNLMEAMQGRVLDAGGTIDDFLGTLPFKLDDASPLYREVKELLGKLDNEPKLRADLEAKQKELAENFGLGEKAKDIIHEAFPILQKLRELEALKEWRLSKNRGLTKKEADALEAQIKRVNEMYNRIKELAPKRGDKIIQLANDMVDRYRAYGASLRKQAEDIFRETYPDKKFSTKSDAYKDIYDNLKKKSSVEKSDIDDKIRSLDEYKQETAEGRTLSTRQDIDDFMQQAQDELIEKVEAGIITEDEKRRALVRLRHTMKDMQGIPTAVDPDGALSSVQRIAGSFNIFRLLQQTMFTMVAEGASTAIEGGIKNMFKSIPMMGKILKSYKTGKLDDPFLREFQEETGFLTEFLSSPQSYELSHDYNPKGWSGAKGKMQSAADNMAEFALMVGGIKPLTAFYRAALAKGVLKKMVNAAKNGDTSENYLKLLNELALSKDTVDKVYKNLVKYSDGGRIGFEHWDSELKGIFLDSMTRYSDTIVQQKRLGDSMGWVVGENLLQSTALGKIALELKTFTLVAYTKQLGRMVSRADKRAALTVMGWTALLSLSYLAKVHWNYAGNDEKLERALTPEAMAKSVIPQIPLMSIFPDIINAGAQVAGYEAPLGYSRHSGVVTDTISSFPTIDLINKLSGAFGIMDDITDEDEELEARDFKSIFDLTGLKGNLATRPIVESILER